MKIIRNAIAAGLIAAASVVACSSQHGSATGTNTGNGGPSVGTTSQVGQNLGSVKGAWTVPPGYSVTSLNWTLTGSGMTAGFSYSGVDTIGSAQSAEFVAGGIVAGCGYTLQMSGTDSNNDPCNGTATNVCVSAGVVTYVQISVVCSAPNSAVTGAYSDAGSLAVEAGVTVVQVPAWTCPGIQSFSISPAEVLGTQTAQVTIVPTVPLAATPPPGVEVNWTFGACGAGGGLPGTGVPTGFQPDSTSLTEAFNCGTCTGQVPVTATVGNWQAQPNTPGVYNNVCVGAPFSTYTGLINCEGGGTFTCPNPALPNICGTAPNQTCVNTSTDPNNCGVCGGICSGAANACIGGVCSCPTGEVASGTNCCPTATPNFCGTSCTSNATDVNNCGTCGNLCATGDSCVAGVCKAPPPVPCTGGTYPTNTPAGCVPCRGNASGVCTTTEAVVMNYDIVNNSLAAGTTTTTASCYYCMVNGSCLDSATRSSIAGISTRGKTGLECEDTANDATENPADCRDALTCTLTGGGTFADNPGTTGATLTGGHGECTTSTPGMATTDTSASVSNCFCGANSGAACLVSNASPIGSCASNEFTDVGGFIGAANDNPTGINGDFITATGAAGSPGGVGNAILNCALTAGCNICFTH